MGKKSTIPIIDNVLITVDNGILNMRTTNLATEMSYSMKLSDSNGFTCLVPCILMLNAIKSIREEEITLSIIDKEESEDKILQIRTKKGRSKLEGYNPEDFPNKKVETFPEEYFSLIQLQNL